MSAEDHPLDELQWRDPQAAMEFGGVHENTVLYYFARSPFFDPTSNNAVVFTQGQMNPAMMEILGTRDSFERHLDTLSGLEFRVALAYRDSGTEAPIGHGMWVIRKQNRRKQQSLPDQVEVLATYYVVGENVYMAPSLADILKSRLLSVTNALSKAVRIGGSLPYFTPSTGYSYFPPSTTSQPEQSSSRAGSVLPSREGTPMQGMSQDDLSKPTETQTTTAPSTDVADERALWESWNSFLRYDGEYINENPLMGEPGNFSFRYTTQHVQAEREKVKQTAAAALALKQAKQEDTSRQPTPPPKAEAVTPFQPKKEKDKTVSERPRMKRKKSRAPTSPTTPTSTVNAT